MATWNINRNGPNWLMNGDGKVIGYRDSLGGEHKIPQVAGVWGDAEAASGPSTAVTATTNPLTGGNTIPALDSMTGSVTASRNLIKEDSGQTLICTSGSAIVLTIQNDATVAWSGLNAVAAYQGGAGAVSFAAGSGVTLRGTAPTAAQYATQGVMRVGANEWAYL